MYYIGIDHHKKYSQYTVMDTVGKVLKRAQVSNRAEEIKDFMESLPEGPKVAAMEASRTWGWLFDEMEKYTEEMFLGNPLEMKAIAHAKVKTDSIDSATIAHLLRSNLLPCCFVPSQEVREVKDQLRFRGFLVKVLGMVKNQIHVLIDRNHVLQSEDREWVGLFSKKGFEALKGVDLPGKERQILDELLKLFESLKSQIEISNGWVEALYESSAQAQLIDTIPGFGHFLSVLVVYEIGDIERFETPKKLCGYAGLVPSTYASGGKSFQGHITKRGNGHLRWALIEAVLPAITSNVVFRTEYEKIRERRGTKIGRVAMGRKLLEWIYRVLKRGQSFQEIISQSTLVTS